MFNVSLLSLEKQPNCIPWGSCDATFDESEGCWVECILSLILVSTLVILNISTSPFLAGEAFLRSNLHKCESVLPSK